MKNKRRFKRKGVKIALFGGAVVSAAGLAAAPFSFDPPRLLLAKPNGDPGVRIDPINVRGPDAAVWLVYLEGYTEQDRESCAAQARAAFDAIFRTEPMASFQNDINVYAVNTLSRTAWTGEPGQDTYFDVRRQDPGYRPRMNQKSKDRLNALRGKIQGVYLDPGAKVVAQTILVNGSVSEFRSFAADGYALVCARSGQGNLANVILHEAAHGFGLSDEYPEAQAEATANAAPSLAAAQDSWGAFAGQLWVLGDRQTELGYFPSGEPPQRPRYVPYDPKSGFKCVMLSTVERDPVFCPVCEYYLFDGINSRIARKRQVYFSDPAVGSATKTDPAWFSAAFRNYANRPIAIRVAVGPKSGRKGGFSQGFELPLSAKPQKLELGTARAGAFASGSAEWTVTDSGTGWAICGSAVKTARVFVSFANESGRPLPPEAARPYVLTLAAGQDHRIGLPTLAGYVFVGDPALLRIDGLKRDLTVTLRYDAL